MTLALSSWLRQARLPGPSTSIEGLPLRGALFATYGRGLAK